MTKRWKYKYDKLQFYYENKKELGLLLINLAISLFGFVLTGITILITCMPEKLKTSLKNADNIFYKQIYGVFFSSLKILGIISIIALISIFTDTLKYLILYFILACTILLALRLARSVWILKHIIIIARKYD